jgi:hypothetical protein
MERLNVEADNSSYAFCLDGFDEGPGAAGWFQNGFSCK